MSIVAKQSFWTMKPTSQTTTSIPAFEQLIMDSLGQFESYGYVEKLKTSITSESLPPNNEDLLGFMYNQIAND